LWAKSKTKVKNTGSDRALKLRFYTLAEGIMISVRSSQRIERDVSDPISIYILDQHD